MLLSDSTQDKSRTQKLIERENEYDGGKTLRRMSRGNKEQAMTIMKLALERYVQPVDLTNFEFDFDWAMANVMGDGCDVEWFS